MAYECATVTGESDSLGIDRDSGMRVPIPAFGPGDPSLRIRVVVDQGGRAGAVRPERYLERVHGVKVLRWTDCHGSAPN